MLELTDFKAGFVSIVGKPNVGKSTLMNRLVGEKLSIISPKPQTTRQSVKGILNTDKMQAVFMDTPGYVEARYELHNKMQEYIRNSLTDGDIIIFITDAHKYPTDYDKSVLAMLAKIKVPKYAILNKEDLAPAEKSGEDLESLKEYGFDYITSISALHDTGFEDLLDELYTYLPYSPPFYSKEDLSDLPMKFFAAEIIREQIFLNYKEEIPYACAVVVEKYTDKESNAVIQANIWLERASQKGILLGHKGERIKKIRLAAEKELHRMIQKRVKIELWVKIKANWRKKKNALKEFGYK